jgi:hypothetical protein
VGRRLAPSALALVLATAVGAPAAEPGRGPAPRPATFGADPALCGRGATLYVSPTGTDAGPGGSRSSPCRQIRRAVELAAPGDTILVAPGSYDAFEVTKDGLSIRAEDPARRPVIAWENELGTGELVRVRASNVTIDGLAGFRATYVGIRVVGDREVPPHHVTIRNCVMGDNGELGIMTNNGVRNLLIERNVTYGTRVQHGIYVANDARDVLIQANVSFDNADAGIQLNGENGPGITGAVIRNNVVYGNGFWTKEGAREGARSIAVRDVLRRRPDGELVRRAGSPFRNGPGIALYHVREARLVNNVLYDNCRGLASMFSGTSGRGIEVFHNTIVMPSTTRAPRREDDEGTLFRWRGTTRVTMHNNIFCAPDGPPSAASYSPATASDYNLFLGAVPVREGSHSRALASLQQLFLDPFSASRGQRDYRLAPGVGFRGTRLEGVTLDMAGRPRGSPPAPGAYEPAAAPKRSAASATR